MTRLILFLLLLLPSLAEAEYKPSPSSAEDTAHVDAEQIMRNGCRRIDTAASSAGTSGDWATVNCTSTGDLRVNTTTATAAAPTYTEGANAPDSSDLAGNKRVTIGTLLSGEDQGVSQATSMIRTSGAVVRQTTVISAVTTNTTSTPLGLYVGPKTIYGQVVCSSGACTQTQALYGDVDNDAANGILLCTLTLSGTTRTQDACPPFSANYSYYYVITTNTTGTAASGSIYAQY